METQDEVTAAKKGEKPFLEHLEELRRSLIHALMILAAGVLIAIPLVPFILTLLKAPLAAVVPEPSRFLRSLEVAGAFTVTLRIAFWSGLLISAPILIFVAGSFVFPGLREREREVILKSSGFAVALFALGVFIAYRITLPVALGLMFRMHGWLGVQAEWTVTSYVAFATQMLIAFGLAFELPVVVLILGRLGILNSTQLRGKRRHVILLLLVLAMILTPPDIFTQIIMALPLVLLYEFCIWLLWYWERKGQGA